MQQKIIITLKDISENGGGERVGVNLANAFAQSGFCVCVVSFFEASKRHFYALDERVQLVCLSGGSAKCKNPLKSLFNRTLKRLFLSYKTHKFIAAQGAQVVLANDGWFVPFCKLKTPLYVRLWHLKAPKRQPRKLSFFDTLVILSSKELAAWQTHHKNVRVIPNFLPQIPSKNADYKQKVVLSVGRMDNGDQKGFSRLLDIWQLLARDEGFKNEFKQWRLVIVGDGVLKGELEAKIQGLGLENVSLKPFTKDIESEYLAASIYAMSSLWEGFGMVLAEASSCALPCVAFDINTGPSDIIAQAKSGFLVADGDLAGFAGRLKILMRDENLRREFGENAKKIVSEKFNKEAVLGKWMELFAQLVKG